MNGMSMTTPSDTSEPTPAEPIPEHGGLRQPPPATSRATAWTAAHFRARLAHLGLTIDQLAHLTGRDKRGLVRQGTGKAPVSSRTIAWITDAERQAQQELARFDDATAGGLPIRIPRLSDVVTAGQMPPSWWHQLAGRHIAQWGDAAQIEYAPDGYQDYAGRYFVVIEAQPGTTEHASGHVERQAQQPRDVVDVSRRG